MISNITDNDTANGDSNAKFSRQQQAQPVVSLLEKYSSLHRGIDEARKEYSQRQLEIESVEGEIHQLIQVDRIENCEAIKISISEKVDLLKKLEILTLNDLLEAQEAEFLARSNRDAVRYREEEANRIEKDEQNIFLNTCKAFREKIRTLCLRGELFGLKTPVALLSVYKTLHGHLPSKSTQKTHKNVTNNDEKQVSYGNDIGSLLFKDANLLWGGNESAEPSNDEEVQDLLQQLREQNESNEKHQAALSRKKETYRCLLEAKEKREKRKKDLKSQCERLQKDARDVEHQIETLNEQTREAIELTKGFRDGKQKK